MLNDTPRDKLNFDVGAPGKMTEVTLRLIEDKDGDGIDDNLLKELKEKYRRALRGSNLVVENEFNAMTDHDGDGVPTLLEVYAGTDPFDANNVFRIVEFKPGNQMQEEMRTPSLAFPIREGRVYYLEACSSLEKKDWKVMKFATSQDGIPVSLLNVSKNNDRAEVFLSPTTNRFFRVRAE